MQDPAAFASYVATMQVLFTGLLGELVGYIDLYRHRLPTYTNYPPPDPFDVHDDGRGTLVCTGGNFYAKIVLLFVDTAKTRCKEFKLASDSFFASGAVLPNFGGPPNPLQLYREAVVTSERILSFSNAWSRFWVDVANGKPPQEPV
jgi:hypothetical protein